MSFVKLINAGDFDSDQLAAALVPLHSRGVDKEWLVKRAGAAHIFDGLTPDPGHELVHLIAMGASDRYGPNRNGDYFYKSAKQLDIPSPDWESVRLPSGRLEKRSSSNFRDRTRVGLKETYGTFETHARVFRDHRNRPERGDKVHGEVKRSAYNDDMDRVELAIQVPTDSWRSDLQKIASGELVPFSMACITDPDALVLTSEGYIPICRVRAGELVMTHRGRWRPVTAALTRKYTGSVKRLKLTGHVRSIGVTADHPLLAVKLSGDEGASVKPAWLHCSHLDVDSHCLVELGYLQSPDEGLELREKIESVTQPSLAYFLGQCVADPRGLSEYERSLFVGDGNENAGHALCLALGMDAACRAAFASGFVDFANACPIEDCETVFWGDDSRVICLLVESEEIALLFTSVLNSLGVTSGMTRCKSAPAGSVAMMLSSSFARVCSNYSDVAEELLAALDEPLDSPCDYEADTFRPVSLESIETAEVEGLTVYNLEVADDHSYVVQGVVSHNCRISEDICNECGHTAKSRDSYCQHLTNGMTRLTKQANLIGAVNDEMTFFDISRVNRPADRIAYALTKAAADAMGVAQTADDVEYERAVLERAQLYADPGSTERARWLGKSRKLAADSQLLQQSLLSAASRVAEKLSCLRGFELSDESLRVLAASGATLPFRAFAKSAFSGLGVDQSIVDEAARYAHRAFDPALMGESLERACLDSTFKCASYAVAMSSDAVRTAAEALDPNRARPAIDARQVKLAFEKAASVPSGAASALLRAYASYKAASLADIASLRGSEDASRAAMLSVAVDLCEVAVS